MTALELCRAAESCPELSVLGARMTEKDGPEVWIKHRGSGVHLAVLARDAEGIDFGQLLDVARGKRPARVMTHVARIVGYYSYTQNWNASKLAELADRRRGDYEVR